MTTTAIRPTGRVLAFRLGDCCGDHFFRAFQSECFFPNGLCGASGSKRQRYKYTDRANDELHGVPPTRTLERPTTELGEIPAYPSPVTRRISSASHVKILG